MPTPPQRDQTDHSLRSERGKVDRELEVKRAHTEATSDQVLADAQGKADAVLESARARADAATQGSSVAVNTERRAEDRALAEERETAADQLAVERDEHRSALAELLRFERDETDKDLKLERVGADTALGSRDAFLGMVSHDLRNLLNGIALNAAMMLRDPPPGDAGATVVKRAENIRRATTRMNRLIADLLDVVSIEAGKLAVVPKPNDLRAALDEAMDTAELAAATKRISLSLSVPDGALPATFDYDRMLQVVVNLLSNAIKFTPEGGAVKVSVERLGPTLQVSVADTGSGIPAEHLEAIFRRFHQVRDDRRGHGLGLLISRTIIEAHGGKIWAESQGPGSTFRFTLPA